MKAYMVYSMGKTGSSSLYGMIKERGDVVIHTHKVDHCYISNLTHPKFDTLVTNNPAYVFDKFGIDELIVIGSFRHPIERKISSFLHDINIDIFRLEPHRFMYDVAEEVVTYYINNNTYPPYEFLEDLFLRRYIEYREDVIPPEEDIKEYFTFENVFIKEFNSTFDCDLDIQSFGKLGYVSGVGSFNNSPITYMMYRFEDIQRLSPIINTYLNFPADTKMIHERNSNDFEYFSQAGPKELKERLRECCRNYVRTIQYMDSPLISQLGYSL